jgi:hypothetical protein
LISLPNIELSHQTYGRLLRRARSFEDTPEDVIGRLLDGKDAALADPVESGDPMPEPPRRATPGSILPEKEYWCPILAEIAKCGGSASANDVIDALEQRMGRLLRPADREQLRMGEVRWRNRARFARLKMREQGLLSSESHRGIWELTEAGRRYLDACAQSSEAP